MKKRTSFLLACLFLSTSFAWTQIPREELLKRITIPSENGLRGLVDLVGFAHTREQMESIVSYLENGEKEKIEANQKTYGFSSSTPCIAGISPHDDYFYAGRGYIHVMKHIKAPRVIIFGVCHWAKEYGLKDQLIFDSFEHWRGPYGNISVSSLREEIQTGLAKQDYLVNDEVHGVEHSVEALLPFLQYFNRQVEIVPVLVPYMKWERMDELAAHLATAMGKILKRNNWKLGKDIAFLISSDCVHYGDYGWGYYHYCPFGTDADGYKKGTDQDLSMIKNFLCGKLLSPKIREFYCKCVEPDDPYTYRISWCGRFSIPLGLNFLSYLMEELGEKPLEGALFRYGTSLTFPTPPFEKANLGTTYYSNLHHWVGFTSIGYF